MAVGAERIRLATGWCFGPHLDLRADAPSSAHPIDWEGVADALMEGATHYPKSDISDEEYLRSATMLGQIEAVPPPYLPRLPHGHIELLAPAQASPLGNLSATGMAHLMAPLLATAGAASDGNLLARVAEAFLAMADTHPHGLRFGAFSLRSHAEAFFHWAGPAADYRSSFETRRETDRATLEELVGRVRDGAASDSAAGWGCAFRACGADFAGRVTTKDIDRATPLDAGPARRVDGRSGFHAAVANSGVIDTPPEWFAGYRLVINLFYQLLPALDVSPIQRFYLCHALAETVDDVYDESWQTRLAAIERHMAGIR
jgi:hypothetical protein